MFNCTFVNLISRFFSGLFFINFLILTMKNVKNSENFHSKFMDIIIIDQTLYDGNCISVSHRKIQKIAIIILVITFLISHNVIS